MGEGAGRQMGIRHVGSGTGGEDVRGSVKGEKGELWPGRRSTLVPEEGFPTWIQTQLSKVGRNLGRKTKMSDWAGRLRSQSNLLAPADGSDGAHGT